MPEHHSLNVHVGTLQEAERLCPIRWIETHTMLGRSRAGALALFGRMTITLPHRVDHAKAERGSRHAEFNSRATDKRRGFPRESQRPPPIRDDPRRDTDPDDVRRPAKPRDAKRDPGRRTTGAERDNDRVGRRVDLRSELECREEVADHRTRIRAASGNPVRRLSSELVRGAPRSEHRPRQRDQGGCAGWGNVATTVR